MKFANKLFFIMTALLTVIFAVFGLWMLSSYFSKTIDRELDRANAESGMFQLMFENGYYSTDIFGDEYAIYSTMGTIAFGIEKNGNLCMVWAEGKEFYCNTNIDAKLAGEIRKMGRTLDFQIAEQTITGGNYYGVGIRKIGEKYYIINVTRSTAVSDGIYLGMCRDISEVYAARKELITKYCISLAVLLLIGSISIYVLSRYITRPIRNLNAVVNEITNGNYEKRCEVKGSDEISRLATNFNEMTNTIVEHMHEKELEVLQKESFTTAFAHELKTPLTSIIGYADMLNTIEMTDKERTEAYYYIYSQGKRLENLSHKLLELTEVDKNPIKRKRISTKELEETLRITMRPVFDKKKIKGKISLEKGVIYADKELILSVFYNLLDNAVKAVEEGGKIEFRGCNLKDGYEIKVTDNGRGIPDNEIHRITEAFYMVDKSRSRKEGGAGIGMALCQKIVTLHDAQMQIHSKLGEGTMVQILFSEYREEV